MMRRDLVILAFIGVVGYAHACGKTGWGEWTDVNSTTTDLFPEEKIATDPITFGGGEIENVDQAVRDAFCVPHHGSITKIQCLSESGKYNYTSDDVVLPHGIKCDVDDGLKCSNRIMNKTIGVKCENFKIRLYCTCTNPISTTAAPATARPNAGSGGTGGAASGGGNTGSSRTPTSAGGHHGNGNTATSVVVCKLAVLLMLFVPSFLL